MLMETLQKAHKMVEQLCVQQEDGVSSKARTLIQHLLESSKRQATNRSIGKNPGKRRDSKSGLPSKSAEDDSQPPKTIILVEMRKTARELCRLLCSNAELQASYAPVLIGQGSCPDQVTTTRISPSSR